MYVWHMVPKCARGGCLGGTPKPSQILPFSAFGASANGRKYPEPDEIGIDKLLFYKEFFRGLTYTNEFCYFEFVAGDSGISFNFCFRRNSYENYLFHYAG